MSRQAAPSGLADYAHPIVQGMVDGPLVGSAAQFPLAVTIGGLAVMLLASLGFVLTLPEEAGTLRPEQVAARPTSRHDLRGRRMALHERPDAKRGRPVLGALWVLATVFGAGAFGLGMIAGLS